jgi:heme/copper-type cytochrome/quinol oxidase subunit 2
MSAGGEQAKTAAFWSWNQNGEVSKKNSIVWVVLLILVFVAALAFVAAVKVHQSRRGLSQYLDLNSMGYTPPIL